MLEKFRDESLARVCRELGSDLRGLAHADIEEAIDTVCADIWASAHKKAEKKGRTKRRLKPKHYDIVVDHKLN